ncbi:hypothetical protein B9Z55_010921 [Caenorhabditis nigoni]|uniref:Uncharacterized protein n=1 Tax=Caenorhabditis nigoni TaxID=1611254 RepID=A0A2G5UHV5_9PELO|nr:hypothetical protein B9Z55_010921 [Caenorhabditis nigoni]
MKPNLNQALINQVFNDSNIVERIMDYIPTNFFMHQLEFRLVNKTFRYVCDGLVRKFYQTLNITHDSRGQYNEVFFGKLYINDEEVKIQHLYKFFEKVVSLNKKKKFGFQLFEIYISIHKAEVEIFTGMDNICHPGCNDCLQIAKQCNEYGPVQLNYLTQPNIPKQFEKLIITDYLLDDVANKCVRSSEVKENCINALNQMITSDISCNILQLNVSGCRRKSRSAPRRSKNAMPMPREILNAILLKWNVKSVILKFVDVTRQDIQKKKWIKSKWFTEFRFNDSYNTVNPSSLDLKFPKVEVDFGASPIHHELLVEDAIEKFLSRASSQNIIANIRRVFPTDRISIRFCQWTASHIRYVFDRLLQQIFRDEYENLEVDIQLVVSKKKKIYFAHSDKIKKNNDVIKYKLNVIKEIPPDLLLKCKKFNETTGLDCYRHELHAGGEDEEDPGGFHISPAHNPSPGPSSHLVHSFLNISQPTTLILYRLTLFNMPSSTSSSSNKSAIPSHGIKKIEKRLTATQYVRKYTEMLVLGVRKTYALERLIDANCPIRAFEENLTEKVLEKHIAPSGMYTYHLNKLTQKFAEIRRKDMITAQRRVAESRECNAYIENQKTILDQKTQEEVNELFAAAMGSTGAPKKTSIKPDYSKYRIVKRFKSTASSSTTSSPTSSSLTSQ